MSLISRIGINFSNVHPLEAILLKSSMNEQKYDYSRLKPLWVAVFVDILGFTLILPYLYFFADDFTDNTILIGLLLSSNAIFSVIFGPILGKLSDKYGRKPLLLISQAGTIIGFILLAFSNSLEMMFIARIVDGIFGGQFPISKAIIGDVVPPKERPKQMTNIGIAFTLAALIGPGAGSLLTRFGILGPGLAASAIAIFTMIFTAVRYRETLPLKTGITEIWHQQANTKTESVKIRKNKPAMHFLTQYAFIALMAQILQGSLTIFGARFIGLQETDIGILFTSMGIFQVVFRLFFFNRIRNAIGDMKTSLVGLGSYILAFGSLLFVTKFWHLILVLMWISFSGAMSRGIILGFASNVVDFRNQGKINGLTSSMDSISQIFGPLVGSAILGLNTSIYFALLLTGIAIIPFLLGFRSFRYNIYRENKTPEIPKKKMTSNPPIAEI